MRWFTIIIIMGVLGLLAACMPQVSQPEPAAVTNTVPTASQTETPIPDTQTADIRPMFLNSYASW